jgi:hypothetical protein
MSISASRFRTEEQVQWPQQNVYVTAKSLQNNLTMTINKYLTGLIKARTDVGRSLTIEHRTYAI